jgi:hydroxymethylbilane synthase
MTELRIATRGSALARIQSTWVGERIQARHPELRVRLVPLVSEGDRDRARSVADLSEVGAFVRSVQEAVLTGEADLAVHSLKDLPVEGPPGLEMVIPERGPVLDVICGTRLSDLPPGARVGTSSPRRAQQLRVLRPDLEPADIRGNVDTRLAQVASGAYQAVVLAEAGLARLGRSGDITQRLTVEEMVPAPGQAALAVEGRARSRALALAAALEHPPTRAEVTLERRLLQETEAGCRSAMGALAEASGAGFVFTAFVADADGPRRARLDGADPDRALRSMRSALGL